MVYDIHGVKHVSADYLYSNTRTLLLLLSPTIVFKLLEDFLSYQNATTEVSADSSDSEDENSKFSIKTIFSKSINGMFLDCIIKFEIVYIDGNYVLIFSRRYGDILCACKIFNELCLHLASCTEPLVNN